MLHKAKTLKGYPLENGDGEKIGSVREFFFDDRYWTIRYLVAETPHWWTGREVLLSPYAVAAVNRNEKDIVVDLTKKQVEDSPSWESDKPVTRQFEETYHEYYGLPPYWGGAYAWGAYPYIARDRAERRGLAQGESAWDPHLRSTHNVAGYHIQATDGEIGHVEDFVIDDETWAIRYLIVGTRNWWPGKKLLISTQWIERVSWLESKIFFNVAREAIKRSPAYTEASLLTRDYEAELHLHYNRHAYWVDELAAG